LDGIEVNKDDIIFFSGKYVKIEFRSGFVIDGRIIKISEEAVFFETKKSTSAIDIRNISSVVLKKNGGINECQMMKN
jgi:hypothetical protein